MHSLTRYYKKNAKDENELDNRLIYKTAIITLNGQGNSGKSTVAEELTNSGLGIAGYTYEERDLFVNTFYRHLSRSDIQRNAEVYGIPSLAWIALKYHSQMKPLLADGKVLILDHYLGDYYADMLPDLKELSHFEKVVRCLKLPFFTVGTHFYFDINYETYLQRRTSREHSTLFAQEISDANSVPLKLFVERKQRYLKLVDMGYLIKIDANTSIKCVLDAVKKHIHKRETDAD